MVPAPPARPANRAPLRILLVDDSADASASLAALLELRGHQVAVAGDGPSALQMVRGILPAVVILDIGLPGMSGHDVARRIRAMRDLPAVVLIALTGYGSSDDRAGTRAAGFDHHFTKPLDFPALDHLLNGPLTPSRATESTATDDSRTA